MGAIETQPRRILLIDTCSGSGGVALAEDGAVLASEALPERSASAFLLTTVRELFNRARWDASQLTAVGVVHGPGSFTGVRVGLAAAKGLCEALQLPLAPVSRLELLARATGLRDGFAALDAGRGELYVRELRCGNGSESLMRMDELIDRAHGSNIVVAEEKLLGPLATLNPLHHRLSVADALPSVLEMLQAGGSNQAIIDANYVRGENQIYGSTGAIRK